MRDVTKAVITAAGRNQRALALQTLVDWDGESRTALHILLNEAVSAGCEDIAVVIAPGDASAYATAAGEHARKVRFIEQHEPRGYGHAIFCTHDFVDNQPFLHLVGDHLWVSSSGISCAKQLVAIAAEQECAVSGVQPTKERELPNYGAVGGKLVSGGKGLYEVQNVLEKPTPTLAEQHLVVPGLRAGNYLCFFGLHVITPTIFTILEKQLSTLKAGDKLPLSAALAQLARQEHYLAYEVAGHRYDLGARYGVLTAQLALALEGKDRSEVLAQLLELLAQRAK